MRCDSGRRRAAAGARADGRLQLHHGRIPTPSLTRSLQCGLDMIGRPSACGHTGGPFRLSHRGRAGPGRDSDRLPPPGGTGHPAYGPAARETRTGGRLPGAAGRTQLGKAELHRYVDSSSESLIRTADAIMTPTRTADASAGAARPGRVRRAGPAAGSLSVHCPISQSGGSG